MQTKFTGGEKQSKTSAADTLGQLQKEEHLKKQEQTIILIMLFHFLLGERFEQFNKFLLCV